MIANRPGFLFWDIGNALKISYNDISKTPGYIKNQWTVYFNGVNFMVYENVIKTIKEFQHTKQQVP